MRTIRLNIEGMHCGACVRRVRAALAGVTGVTVREVAIGHAEVEVADEVAEGAPADAEGAVRTAVLEAGFHPTPA